MSSVEKSLSYAALILADAEAEISAENLFTLISKANIEADKIWADIYSKALAGQNVKELLTKFAVGAGPAVGGAAGAAAGGAAADEAAEEEAEEEEEESDDDMGFGLFD